MIHMTTTEDQIDKLFGQIVEESIPRNEIEAGIVHAIGDRRGCAALSTDSGSAKKNSARSLA